MSKYRLLVLKHKSERSRQNLWARSVLTAHIRIQVPSISRHFPFKRFWPYNLRQERSYSYNEELGFDMFRKTRLNVLI